MTTMRTLMLLAAGLGAATLIGCGADVPEHPTWQNDVYPIMVARCIRCHDATLGESDPLSRGGLKGLGNFDHASYSDFTDPTDLNAVYTAPARIVSDVPGSVMPPPPAAKLAQWQIDTITRFVKDNMPKQ